MCFLVAIKVFKFSRLLVAIIFRSRPPVKRIIKKKSTKISTVGLKVGPEKWRTRKKTFFPFKSSLRMDGATFAKARVYFVKRMYPSRSINTHIQIYANKVVFYT